MPEQGLEQVLGAGGRQWVEPQLPVIRLVPPAVLVLGAVVDEQADPGGREALDQTVEDCLRLGIDPVEVLADQQQRLHLALPQEQALDGLQGALAALGGSRACHNGSSAGTSSRARKAGSVGLRSTSR
jgi:hypothetical protein